MIQNILGILVGSLITLASLLLLNADSMEEYITALVIGGIANGLWPLVAGIWIARRAKARREEAIQDEVNKQINAQK